MSRKLPHTPRSRVRSALRALYLRSRERAAAIKREGNCCEECGAKGSKAKGREVKINVHHRDGIDWDRILEHVYLHVLVHPDGLDVLCEDCHKEAHQQSANITTGGET